MQAVCCRQNDVKIPQQGVLRPREDGLCSDSACLVLVQAGLLKKLLKRLLKRSLRSLLKGEWGG